MQKSPYLFQKVFTSKVSTFIITTRTCMSLLVYRNESRYVMFRKISTVLLAVMLLLPLAVLNTQAAEVKDFSRKFSLELYGNPTLSLDLMKVGLDGVQLADRAKLDLTLTPSGALNKLHEVPALGHGAILLGTDVIEYSGSGWLQSVGVDDDVILVGPVFAQTRTGEPVNLGIHYSLNSGSLFVTVVIGEMS